MSLLAYRKRYYLWHPWEAVCEVYGHCLTFWQRGRRGWADSDTWNMDRHLAEIIGPMLRYLAETSHGSPAGGGLNMQAIGEDDEWKIYLCELARAYDDYLEALDGEDCYVLETYEPIVERMRGLFDRYPSLWS